MTTFAIPAQNLFSLRAKIEKLARKAVKLGLRPVTLVEVERRSVSVFIGFNALQEPVTRTVVYVDCEVSGTSPKIAGWTLAAAIDFVEGGVILREVPGESIPESFRNADRSCQHCNSKRIRRNVFICRNVETGEYKQVGRQCVADFLGHPDAEMFAQMAESIRSIQDECGEAESFGYGSGDKSIYVPAYLEFVACAIRTNMFRGFQYRFYPSPEQENFLRRTLGCVRLVYNRALAERSAAWTNGKKSIGYIAQSANLTAWKKTPELAFLNEVSSVPMQQTLRHLQAAYSNFFAKRARYPSFKRKSSGGSAEFVGGAIRFRDGRLILPKMSAPLDIRWSRPLPKDTQPSTVTITLDPAGRWHVSLLCDDTSIKPLPRLKTAIGIDVGITSLATLSTGEKITNPKYDAEDLKRKRVLSRRLARKQKGSKNRNKTKLKLARLHAHVTDRRKDHLHKLTTRLVRENQVIVVEDLNVSGMVQNRKLARVISDAAWGEMFRQLEYKSDWYGRDYVKVDRFYPSSKTCSACGFIVERLPLSVRTWTCEKCGVVHDRDLNASRNILAAGLAVSACGPDVRQRILRGAVQSGLKQELTEVTK